MATGAAKATPGLSPIRSPASARKAGEGAGSAVDATVGNARCTRQDGQRGVGAGRWQKGRDFAGNLAAARVGLRTGLDERVAWREAKGALLP